MLLQSPFAIIEPASRCAVILQGMGLPSPHVTSAGLGQVAFSRPGSGHLTVLAQYLVTGSLVGPALPKLTV